MRCISGQCFNITAVLNTSLNISASNHTNTSSVGYTRDIYLYIHTMISFTHLTLPSRIFHHEDTTNSFISFRMKSVQRWVRRKQSEKEKLVPSLTGRWQQTPSPDQLQSRNKRAVIHLHPWPIHLRNQQKSELV